MAYIKFNNSQEKLHDASILPISDNIIEIRGIDVEDTSGVCLYLDNDIKIADYSDYGCVYRILDSNIIQYSNDKSKYTEPKIIEPIPYIPTEEELAEIERQNKIDNLNAQIELLRAEIASTDYIIIKVSELSFVDKECTEYNIAEIHAERQALRDKINELEKEIELL